ncbi:PH domain-containing protein [Modestobacter sp. SYSU DS0290]
MPETSEPETSEPGVAASAPVTAVPRRLRLVTALAAAGLVGVMVVVAVLLKESSTGVVAFQTADQMAMVGLGLALGAGVLVLGRSRVQADAEGIRVRNMLIEHQLPWAAVRAVRFDEHSPWASLLLTNGDELAVTAVQATDGVRAVAAVRGLRALLADHQERTATPAPDLLYPWE